MHKHVILATCAVGLSLGNVAHAQLHITIGPPAPVVERVPPPPPEHRDWAWHAGYYRYDGARYIWVPGAYVVPPHPHAHWVEGHWVNRHGEWVWREGHWA